MGYKLDFSVIWKNLPLLLKGAWFTVEVSTGAILVAILVGIVMGVAKTSRHQFLRFPAAWYVETFRNTPLLIQIFFIYFGLPQIGLKLSPFMSGFAALVLYTGAYNTEVVRAGLEAIPKGQIEAARSLGFTEIQTIRYVIVPQAFRISLPALSNNFIALLKNSSLVSVIGMVELTFIGNELTAWTFRAFEVYGAITVLYLALVFSLSWILAIIERRIRLLI